MMQNFEGTTGRAFSSAAAKDDEKKTKEVNKGGEKTGDESTSNPLAGMMFPWSARCFLRLAKKAPRRGGTNCIGSSLRFDLLIASNRVREQFEQKDETEKRDEVEEKQKSDGASAGRTIVRGESRVRSEDG